MERTRSAMRILALACAVLAGIAMVGIGARRVIAAATHINTKLVATAAAPQAAGSAKLHLPKATKGQFAVSAKHLNRNAPYDVIVGGVKVGTIQTNHGGNGRAAFSTSPKRKSSLLGFDPRGSNVIVRDPASGSDVLVGTVPDDTPGDGACCLTDSEGETECEDLAATDCTNQNGTVPMVTNPDGSQTAATSCLPDPCNPGATPPSGVATACCLSSTHDDGSETECEDASEFDCAAAGGTVIQVPGITPGDGDPCDANPCQPAPAVNVSACCTTEADGDAECEMLSADTCTAAGGVSNASATCDPNPCAVTSPATSACCLPPASTGAASECEDLSASDCSAGGGSAPSNGSTSCDPNPC